MTAPTHAVDLLEDIRRLMHLKGENVFKVRAFEKAQQAIAEVEDLAERARSGRLTEIPGVGKSIAEILEEFLLHGTSRVRDELRASLPAGLEELTAVPGVGPKKAMQLIAELGIQSVSELEYACRENRLIKLKGFGEKIQQKILEGIAFAKTTAGRMRLDEAMELAERVRAQLAEEIPAGLRLSETGALRRRLETMSEIDFLVEVPAQGAAQLRERVEQRARGLSTGVPVRVHFAAAESFGYELARTTGTPEHWRALGAPATFAAREERDFFAHVGVEVIAPEARETGEEVTLAREGRLGELLPLDGVRGVFHNHTVRSDGRATLEEMVVAAKRLGYQYIGISDHSQTAAYAQGLKVPDLLDQEREIRELQDKHPEIRIFWGIESDILQDGSLDYSHDVLARFDFVVASVHQRYKADRATMTERILQAVRNPATRFLGHVTGRLLLGRAPYDLDMERVIAEAARCDVAIEINANPARLDIDWRWGPQLRAHGTPVSVNPDAHETAGLEDTRYGIAMARKALLPRGQIVNARSVAEVERWLKRSR